MKLSTLIAWLFMGLATLQSASSEPIIMVNVERPDDDQIVDITGEDRALSVISKNDRELQRRGRRWKFVWYLPYPVWIRPGYSVRFRICFWYWGFWCYHFWWWRWWFYGWPYWPGYYWYPYWWWWWRKVYYPPFYYVGRDRQLQLNVHGDTEGPASGNDIGVGEDGVFTGQATFDPTQVEFKAHGIDFRLSIPKDAPGPVQITEITGEIDAEDMRFEDKHPEMFGDPHIQTWLGQYFEYSGECDLVFLRDRDFWNGLGLEIDTRTRHRYQYSYIESAAVKIGDDILEVGSFGEYALNGVDTPDLENESGEPAKIAQFPIYHRQPEEKKHYFDIVLNERSNITLSTFKDIVAVQLSGDNLFSPNTTGILGSIEGDMLARDGETLISDPNEFGQEWQVRDDEPMLFRTAREPQWPAKCKLPDGSVVEERRLGDPKRLVQVTEEQAEKACSHLEGKPRDGQKYADCVADVVAFNDVDIAHAGVY